MIIVDVSKLKSIADKKKIDHQNYQKDKSIFLLNSTVDYSHRFLFCQLFKVHTIFQRPAKGDTFKRTLKDFFCKMRY